MRKLHVRLCRRQALQGCHFSELEAGNVEDLTVSPVATKPQDIRTVPGPLRELGAVVDLVHLYAGHFNRSEVPHIKCAIDAR